MSYNVVGNDPGVGSATSRSTLRLGIVKEQDPSLARLRVTFNEFDQLLSYWLPVVVPKTQNDKAYWLPDIGEQVVCIMDERDEDGVVLGAIYSQADATPVQDGNKFHLGFKDGAAIEYDRGAHVLALTFADTAAFKYDSDAHLLALTFEDQTSIKYDSSAHSLALDFNDGSALRYDASVHALTMVGSAGTSVTISAPVGITLESGDSYVTILPNGVTIHPPLS